MNKCTDVGKSHKSDVRDDLELQQQGAVVPVPARQVRLGLGDRESE